MKEKTADIDILEEKIEKDYRDMMKVINSTSLPLFVEDTIEDMHILIETLIVENKELKGKNKKIDEINFRVNKNLMETAEKLESEKEKNSKAREFIKENSHEFNCKRDGLIELEFDYNTNATDLIDILDGNW